MLDSARLTESRQSWPDSGPVRHRMRTAGFPLGCGPCRTVWGPLP